LLAVTVGVFGLELGIEGRWDALSFEQNFRTATLYQAGALYRPAILNGEYGRLLTAMFVHANLLHLLLNGLLLLGLGWRLERYLGAWRVGLIYLLTGLGASVISFGFTLHSRDLAVGASGAIFGLAGALLGFSIRHWSLLHWQAWLLAGVLLLNLTVLNIVPGTDNRAHLAGLVGGLWLGLLGTPPSRSLTAEEISPDSTSSEPERARGLLLAALAWAGLSLALFAGFYLTLK
jgi:rhomboid protease GluP